MRQSVSDEHEHVVRSAIEPLVKGETLSVEEIADRAAYSRFHFQRIFKELMGETPGEIRRRLLLERAAWIISRTEASATEAAFECGFESLEGFGRAFKRAFGVLPSQFRGAGVPLWLATPNSVHFTPLGLIPTGGKNMDLIDRLLDNESATMRHLFGALNKLHESELDERLPFDAKALSFDEKNETLRDLLHTILFTLEIWIAAVEKQEFEYERDKTLAGMIRRAEVILPIFAGLVRRVRDAGEWDTEFEDDLCEPPERFSFGGMIAHVITHNTYRRQLALAWLRHKGVDEVGWGDPLFLEKGVVPN